MKKEIINFDKVTFLFQINGKKFKAAIKIPLSWIKMLKSL